MELKESIPKAPVQEKEREWTEESAARQALILNLDYFLDWNQNKKQLAINSKEEIKKMVEAGVDLLTRAVQDGELNPYCAVAVLKEIPAPKALTAIESLLVSDRVVEDIDGSTRHELLSFLSLNNRSSSAPVVFRFGEKILEKIVNRALEDTDSRVSYWNSKDFEFAVADLGSAINVLQNLSDSDSYKSANKLFERYNELKSKIEELKKSVPDRLPSFLDESYRVNLGGLPKLPQEDMEKIDKIIRESSPVNSNSEIGNMRRLNSLSAFGLGAIPILYQAIKEGRLTGYYAFWAVQQFRVDEVFQIYYDLLLSASQNGSVFQNDILAIITGARKADAIRIVAEFARRSAEGALRSVDRDRALTFAANFHHGLTTLNSFGSTGSKEAEQFGLVLANIYPEMVISDYPGKLFSEPKAYLWGKSLGIPSLESPEVQMRRQWQHTKMMIRGSALFAEILGRGKDKVRDVDIFVTFPDTFGEAESMRVGYFNNVDSLKYLLPPEEFLKLKTWLEQRGYVDRKINLVRMPESRLSLEESFMGEPRLDLWRSDFEELISGGSEGGFLDKLLRVLKGEGHKNELKNYLDGKPDSSYKFPDRLIPNGILTRALRILDLRERFDLEYDATLLEEAEKLARNGELIISATPTNQLIRGHSEINGETTLDSTFIRVFTDKNLRKLLLKHYPRLGQVAEEIAAAGGVENYIRQNYGEVYLQTRGFVRQYDIDLSKSPASLERQKRFIEEWYLELRKKKDFTFVGSKKLASETNLPRPEGLEKLVDKERLKKALEKRKTRENLLENAVGVYRIAMESMDPFELRRKINSFLEVMNLEWPATKERDKKKVSTTLIKLGVHPKNPVLAQFDSSRSHELQLAISGLEYDVLQASTGKPWTSCMELGQENNHRSLYEDVGGGTLIAYLMKDNQFVARALIRVGVTLNNFKPAAAIERPYGDERYSTVMREAVKSIITELGIRVGEPMMTHDFGMEIYQDSATGRSPNNNLFYYTE